MTPEQLAAVEAEVAGGANLVGNMIGVVDPQLMPFIIIGKAVAAGAPVLVSDVQNWIADIKAGKDPTPDDNKALAAKIATLQHPESL